MVHLCDVIRVIFARMCEFSTALLQAALIRPPPPEEILRLAPPRCMLAGRSAHSDANAKHDLVVGPLRDALIATLRRQLTSGTQCGVAVCVYWHGVPVAHVCGGGDPNNMPCSYAPRKASRVCSKTNAVYRATGSGWQAKWQPVQQDTLFMGYSVVKGVAATCLMSCVDAGEVAYDQVLGGGRCGFDNV